MKNTYKPLLNLMLMLFVCMSMQSQSQSEFFPGYVQLTKNDTLFGMIEEKGNISSSTECIFRSNASVPSQYYYPHDIYGYRFSNGKYYVARKFISKGDTISLFLEYLVDGVIDLYFYRDADGDHYLIEKDNLPLKEISRPKEFQYINGRAYYPNSLIYSNILRYYMNDCPDLHKEIESLKSAQQKELIQLTKKYHDISCPNEACIIFEKRMPKIKVNIQPVAGVTYLGKYFLFTDLGLDTKAYKPYFQYGINAYFWLPNESEKLFLKTGIIYIRNNVNYYHSSYSNFEDYYVKEKYGIKFPVHFHYQFFRSNVTPVVNFGFNGYYTSWDYFFVNSSVGAGINAKITDRIHFNLSGESEYLSPLIFIPFKQVAFSLLFGVTIKL